MLSSPSQQALRPLQSPEKNLHEGPLAWWCGKGTQALTRLLPRAGGAVLVPLFSHAAAPRGIPGGHAQSAL